MPEAVRPEATEEQRAAVRSRAGDVLVEAGAGSGKTTTTVERYMSLLEELEGDTRRLLVFTFTDKAATELRNRVRERLGREASLSGAWVGTFHSICRRILASHPIAAGVDPSFSVLDDVEAVTLKRQAFQRALGAALEADPGLARTVGLYGEWSARNTVIAVHDELRSRGQARPRLPDCPEVDLEGGLAALRDEAVRARELERLSPRQRDCLDGMLALLATGAAPPSAPEALEELRFGSERPELVPCVEAVDRAIADLAASSGSVAYRHLAALLAAYDEAFAAAKAARNGLDYEDLQLSALELLRSSPGIRDSYRDRFREVMVDEFQDTNRLQVDLVEQLRGPETSLFTVGDEMQSIYGFRHADISLFRSRRDDDRVEVLPMAANFRSQAAVIGAVNAVGRVLDRQMGERGAPDGHVRHRFTPLVVGAAPVPDPGGPEVELIVTDREGWAQLDLGPLSRPEALAAGGPTDAGRHEAEALAVAHRIRELVVEEGVAPQGEVALLTRTKKRLDTYRRALEQVGLDPYVVGGAGFWETREGIDLRSLLSVVANPLDDDSLLGALASPACALSTDGMWRLRAAAGPNRHLWPALAAMAGAAGAEVEDRGWADGAAERDRERAARFVAAVEGVRGRSAGLSLERLVEATVTGTGYDLAAVMADPSGSGMANLRRVMSLARDYESRSGRDLRGFLGWTEVSAELNDEATVATHEEDSDVVRLMTIHKAKGLEFDVVVLPELARGLRAGREDSRLRIGPAPRDGGEPAVGLRLNRTGRKGLNLFAWRELAEARKAEDLDEELRLFHVAMTRARRRLVLSGVRPRNPGSVSQTAPVMDRLVAGFDVDVDEPGPIAVPAPEARPGIPAPGPSEIAVARVAATEEEAARLRRAHARPERHRPGADAAPPLERPEEPALLVRHLSFSSMSQGNEEEQGGTVEPGGPEDLERALPGEQGTDFGNAVHKLLEAAARRRWRPPSDREVRRALELEGGPDAAREGFERARRMVDGWLGCELRRRLDRARLELEVPFLLEVPEAERLGPRAIRGAIDVLALPEEGDPLIVDYKTNRLAGREPAEAMAGYALQRQIYALAVAEALGVERVVAAYSFLERPGEPVVESLGPAELERARADLADRVRRALDPASVSFPPERGRAARPAA